MFLLLLSKLLLAAISHGAVDGINFQTLFPLIILCLLMVSYPVPSQTQPGENLIDYFI
jgi:hypothetical protein